MYVQFVDDDARQTLAQVTTLGMDAKVNMATAKTLGEKAAAAAQEKGIRKIVVDRGGFKFHGRVKMIVESAVAGGLCITTDDAAAGDAGKESK
jgi:large subunit ribosomal protein L18